MHADRDADTFGRAGDVVHGRSNTESWNGPRGFAVYITPGVAITGTTAVDGTITFSPDGFGQQSISEWAYSSVGL